jgi:hypothetical protein
MQQQRLMLTAVSEGLHIHEAARAAILTNVAIATALENGDTAGGVTLATGDRILVKVKQLLQKMVFT